MSTSHSAHVEKLKAKLDEWDSHIAKLEAQARTKQADARISYDKALADLRERRAKAKHKLDAFEHASEGALDDLKHGFERALSDMSDAYKRAAARFG